MFKIFVGRFVENEPHIGKIIQENELLKIIIWGPKWNFVTCIIVNHVMKRVGRLSRLMTKPTKWLCAQRRLRSAWASAQSSLSTWRKLRSLPTHWAPLSTQRRLWSDWADAQADLSLRSAQSDQSLRWAHINFVGFVMRWLIFSVCLFVTV